MAPLNESDFAIIAGVGHYRDRTMATLKGATRDARDFYDWVVSPTGGAVPPGNVELFPRNGEPDPTFEELKSAFVSLHARGADASYLGRRLYIYLAGHGIAQGLDEASVFAADGGPAAEDRHIPGWCYTQMFRMSAFFEEVVLFADCCRIERRSLSVRSFTENEFRGQRPDETLWVRGFAASYGQVAIELRRAGERGLFTEVLLEALEHARDAAGRVTPRSIHDYLLNHRKLAEWRGRMDPLIEFGGQARRARGKNAEIVFSVGSPRINVRLRVKPGEQPTILGGPEQGTWEARPGAGGGDFVADLPRGIYKVAAGGRERFFELNGEPTEVRDVSL